MGNPGGEAPERGHPLAPHQFGRGPGALGGSLFHGLRHLVKGASQLTEFAVVTGKPGSRAEVPGRQALGGGRQGFRAAQHKALRDHARGHQRAYDDKTQQDKIPDQRAG